MRRVVVTGLGVVAPAGLGVDAFWKQIRQGASTVGRITKFDPEGLPSQIAAEVIGFEPEEYLPRRDVVRTDTFIHYALAATQEALLDAKLEPSSGDPRIGVSIGTALGGLPLIFRTYDGLLREQMRGVNPYAMPGFLPNMAAGWVSMRAGARGPIACATTACAAGAQAIGDASRFIARNEADIMIAGGTDALISPFVVACFGALRALSVRNDAPARGQPAFRQGSGRVRPRRGGGDPGARGARARAEPGLPRLRRAGRLRDGCGRLSRHGVLIGWARAGDEAGAGRRAGSHPATLTTSTRTAPRPRTTT